MDKQQIVIVTGMHRSGTSLIASLLQRAGLNVGDNLLDDIPGNPRGHFEDVDFVNFHEKILADHEEGTYLRSLNTLAPFSAEQIEKAKNLIAARCHQPVWGWKDPRTSLFLDDWHQLLPQAKFIFIYRHPLEVLISLLRRGIDDDILYMPAVGVKAWHVYNTNILRFYNQHPSRCFLADLGGITADLAEFVIAVNKKLALTLDNTVDLQALFHPKDLHQHLSPKIEAVFKRYNPKAAFLYEQLEKIADLPPFRDYQNSDPTRSLVQIEALFAQKFESDKLKQAMLPFLVAVADPEAFEQYWLKLDRSVREWRRTRIWFKELEAYTRQLEGQNETLGQSWQDQKKYIETLQHQLEENWQKTEELGQAWHEQQTYIETLQIELEQERRTLLKRFERGIKKLFGRRETV